MFHPAYSPGKRWVGTWLRAAEAIIAMGGVDVPMFVAAQFAVVKPFPQPNMLCGERAFERYRQHGPSLGEERQRKLEFELSFIQSREKIGVPVEELLRNEGTPLSALFRFCVAANIGDTETEDRYAEAARMQLTDPTSRKVYESLVPWDRLGGVDGCT